MRWTVSVPVWGSWHVRTYVERVLWRHVLMGLDDCHYIVHTDRWNEINESAAMRRLKRFCEVEYRPLPLDCHGHQKMTACHLDAMKDAEAIMFLPPDSMISVEAFDFVKSCGKQLVVAAGLRTYTDNEEAYPLYGPELCEWSAGHLHPNWKGLLWGSSDKQAAPPTVIYFKSETGFWMHAFHLHPLAAIRGDKKWDCKNTVDGDFVELYGRDETYVVANREFGYCEITSRAKGEGENCWDISSPSAVATFMRTRANSMHQHFFKHRIMLSGTYNQHADTIPMSVLDRLNS